MGVGVDYCVGDWCVFVGMVWLVCVFCVFVGLFVGDVGVVVVLL